MNEKSLIVADEKVQAKKKPPGRAKRIGKNLFLDFRTEFTSCVLFL
jgi:hypothetical protein